MRVFARTWDLQTSASFGLLTQGASSWAGERGEELDESRKEGGFVFGGAGKAAHGGAQCVLEAMML